MKGERIDWVDVAKGIGVICVIAGHLFKTETVICRIIFSFHMPLFYFISGLMFSGKIVAFGEYLKKKVKSLLLPYLLIGLMGVMITVIVSPFTGGFPSKESILANLYSANLFDTFYVGQIWFLISLFIVGCTFYFVQQAFCKEWQMIVFIFAMIEVSFAMQFINNYLPYGKFPMMVETHSMGISFFAMGYLMKAPLWALHKKISRGGVKYIHLIVLLLTVIMTLSYFNGWVNIAIPQYNDTFNYIFFACIGIFWVSTISMIFQRNRVLKYIGRNSLIIFGIHSIPLYTYIFLLKKTKLDINAGVVNVKFTYALIGTILVNVVMLTFSYFFQKMICFVKGKCRN